MCIRDSRLAPWARVDHVHKGTLRPPRSHIQASTYERERSGRATWLRNTPRCCGEAMRPKSGAQVEVAMKRGPSRQRGSHRCGGFRSCDS
eukprot:8363604-Alexandrium_andersonii.AAC.1